MYCVSCFLSHQPPPLRTDGPQMPGKLYHWCHHDCSVENSEWDQISRDVMLAQSTLTRSSGDYTNDYQDRVAEAKARILTEQRLLQQSSSHAQREMKAAVVLMVHASDSESVQRFRFGMVRLTCHPQTDAQPLWALLQCICAMQM